MSTVGTAAIGVAWAIVAMAAFAALSASALARSRQELEVDPRSASPAGQTARDRAQSISMRASAQAQWLAIETVPTRAVLSSSPSVVYLHATSGHAETGPLHL